MLQDCNDTMDSNDFKNRTTATILEFWNITWNGEATRNNIISKSLVNILEKSKGYFVITHISVYWYYIITHNWVTVDKDGSCKFSFSHQFSPPSEPLTG